jgi:hypothetical protein
MVKVYQYDWLSRDLFSQLLAFDSRIQNTQQTETD